MIDIATLAVGDTIILRGEEVTVTDGSFVADKAGENVITVTATDKAGNTASKQIVVDVTAEDELNTFDDQKRITNVKGRGLTEVSLNTDSKYIRYGNGSLKLEVKEHIAESWPCVIVEN